jgi:hypothetical protein
VANPEPGLRRAREKRKRLRFNGHNWQRAGLILISGRSFTAANTAERRRQTVADLNIRIQTYDYLLDALSGRLRGLAMQSGARI